MHSDAFGVKKSLKIKIFKIKVLMGRINGDT